MMDKRGSILLGVQDNIFEATKRNDLTLIKKLLSSSCSPNQVDQNQWTPLHFTCAYNNFDLAKIMLEFNADLSAVDKGGRTPLHFSCRSGSIPLIDLLIENSADVNAKDLYSRTPLHHLFTNASQERSDSVALLLDHGAKIELQDNNGETSLHLAAKIGDTKSMKKLISKQHSLVHSTDQQNQTPLHKASFVGNHEAIRLLLEANGDATGADRTGRTPLHYTCYHKHKSVVKLLLENNGNLKALDHKKKSPIQLVAERGNLSLLTFLLEKTKMMEYDGICYDTITPATSAWLIRQSVAGPRTTIIDLRATQLDWLPTADSFWQNFQDLKEIHLEDNQLQSIPTSVLLAGNLEQIHFANNPLLDFPEYTKKDWPTLCKHLHTLRRNAIDWQERKIILVGPSAGGKTSVQQVLSKGRKIKCNSYTPTQELQIESEISFAPLYKKIFFMDRNPYVFSIWDLCGNREMFPLHQCFLTSNSIYLLVFDITKWREQLHSIDEWVQQIVVSGCNGTRTPIVFVATHRDGVPFRLVETEQKSLYKNIHKRYPLNRFRGVVDEVFLLSCKTREGFLELQETLEQLAGVIQPVGSAQWMRVHEHLKFKKNKKKQTLLPLESFIRISEVHGVTDRGERKKMTHFLRGIGTLDYFIDHDSDLRDIVILDSAWLSREISRWIQVGTFTGNDENLLGQVLHIAEQLGVVHVLENGTAMIPNTLPATKPSQITNWKDSSTTSNIFEHGRLYRFGYIPDGLFSRIISRILSMHKVKLLSVWRYGVVIQLKHQLATITHTPVISGNVVHEVSIRCQLSENILFKKTSREDEILNPHELLLYRLIILIRNFVHCYFPHILQCAMQWIPCFHCIDENRTNIHYFHVSELQRANEKKKEFVYCKYPHGGSFVSKPLWIPLLVPDLVEYQIDLKWNERKSWLQGCEVKIPPTKLLVPRTRDHHFHRFKKIHSASQYTDTNEFVSLNGITSQRRFTKITCVSLLSPTIIWIGYDSGSIGTNHISDQVDISLLVRITRWKAHQGSVLSLVSVSKDETLGYVLSTGEDGVIRTWNAQTTLEQRSFYNRRVIDKLIVSQNHTNNVRVWSISSEESFVTVWNPIDFSCERIPLFQENQWSTYSSDMVTNCIEVHGDYVLIARGFWIFVLSVLLPGVIAVWKMGESSNIIGLRSIGGSDILLSWSNESPVVNVWYLIGNADEEVIEGCELIGHTSNIVYCCSTKYNNQLYIWSSSVSGEVIIWDAAKLEPIFCLLLRSPEYPTCYATQLHAIGKTMMITTSYSENIHSCRTLFFSPTPYLCHRESIDYSRLSKCLSENEGSLFSKFIAPGDELLDTLEHAEYFKEAVLPLIENIVFVAENAVVTPLSELLSIAENCTKFIRGLASLVSEDGMLAGDLVLPMYIYGVTMAMNMKQEEFPVYHNLIYLQYRFQSFGDDNDACQLTHIIAGAIVTPRLFDIILHAPSQIQT